MNLRVPEWAWKATARFTARSRAQRFELFMDLMRPGAHETVLDVGVVDTDWRSSNPMEMRYPWPERITAVALGDVPLFRRAYPTISVVVADGRALPFPDDTFDIGFSNAVIEHVGSREEQGGSSRSWCARVVERRSRRPTRHSPSILTPCFRAYTGFLDGCGIARSGLRGNGIWADEQMLNPLTARQLAALFPTSVKVRIARQRVLGFADGPHCGRGQAVVKRPVAGAQVGHAPSHPREPRHPAGVRWLRDDGLGALARAGGARSRGHRVLVPRPHRRDAHPAAGRPAALRARAAGASTSRPSRTRRMGALDTLLHPYDAVLLVNAANALFAFLPRLRGAKVALNVDGIERQRAKWGLAGRLWYTLGERLSPRPPERHRGRRAGHRRLLPRALRPRDDAHRLRRHAPRPRPAAGPWPPRAPRHRARPIPPLRQPPRAREPGRPRHPRLRATCPATSRCSSWATLPTPPSTRRELARLAAADPRVRLTGALYGEAYTDLQRAAHGLHPGHLGGRHASRAHRVDGRRQPGPRLRHARRTARSPRAPRSSSTTRPSWPMR